MKINKVISISDHGTTFWEANSTLNELKDFEIVLGELRSLFFLTSPDYNHDYTIKNESLFPERKIRRLDFQDLSRNTLINIRIRPDHFLFNTTLYPKDISKEIFYDAKNRKLTYLFFNFKKDSLAIRPRIAKDDLGILDLLKDDLEDNLLREYILNLMSAAQLPVNIRDVLYARAKNAIRYEGTTIAIRYNGWSEMKLSIDNPLIDIIYIIKNKIDTNEISKMWEKLRGEKSNDTTAHNTLSRTVNRYLDEKIGVIEINMQIPFESRFSTFVKQYIHFDTSSMSIKYTAPDSIKWYFDLPEDLSQLI